MQLSLNTDHISQSIIRAVESNYMQNNKADLNNNKSVDLSLKRYFYPFSLITTSQTQMGPYMFSFLEPS